MRSFSERTGLIKIKTEIQRESVDEPLRNQLWNLLDKYFWRVLERLPRKDITIYHRILKTLWNDYYKETYDSIPPVWNDCYYLLRKKFMDNRWFEVLDFLEAFTKIAEKITVKTNVPQIVNSRKRYTSVYITYFRIAEFRNECNIVFEKELRVFTFRETTGFFHVFYRFSGSLKEHAPYFIVIFNILRPCENHYTNISLYM